MDILGELYGVNGQSLLIFATALLTGYFLWNKNKKIKLPPGPAHLPIVGSLPWLGSDIREPLRRMSKEYGDVMTVYLGSRCTVMLNNYDAIKDAFVKYGHVLAGRPQDLFFISEITDGLGIVSTEGEMWKNQRRYSHTVMRDFGMGKSIIEERIVEELSHFTERFKYLSSSSFNPKYTIQMTVANVIGNIVWGKRSDYDDQLFIHYMKIMNESFEVLGNSGVLTAFPFLGKLPGDPFNYKRLMKTTLYMKQEFRQKIKEHKLLESGSAYSDFMDAYLAKIKREEGKDKTSFHEEQLVAIIGDLFGAGTETTTNTLIWAIIYMLNYPDVMKKVQNQIDDVIGREKILSMRDKQDLPYVEATILEIQRLSEVVPFGVPHSSLEDVEFWGYQIPKGTTIMANQYAAHRDERVWQNPDCFNPNRFLDGDGNISRKEQLISFSIGKRVCLGEALARMELFLFFTTLFQRFDIELPKGAKMPPLTGKLSITHTPPEFQINITLR